MARRSVGEFETLGSVAVVLIAIQMVLAALLMTPSAPSVGLPALLALLFLDFLVLIALFQFPLPVPLRLGVIAAMMILLLVVGARSDPLGLRAVNREVTGSTAREGSDTIAGEVATAQSSAGAAGARLILSGNGPEPFEARLGGVAAEGLSISMRVIERDDAAILLDWSVARLGDVRRCGRITVFAAPELLWQQVEPIVSRSVKRSTASGAPRCY